MSENLVIYIRYKLKFICLNIIIRFLLIAMLGHSFENSYDIITWIDYINRKLGTLT